MRKAVLKLLPALILGLAIASPASARRTVIDGSGPLTLGGYCDFNGDDCTPVNLGYSVDFGSGRLTQILIYGNGLLSFGPNVANLAAFNDSLADFGVPVVSPGLNPEVGSDSLGVDNFLQSATLTLAPGGVIKADWFSCPLPSTCTDDYSLTLTPTAGGYLAVGGFQTLPQVAAGGYSIPGVANVHYDILPNSFVIPATFGTVPEPATWAMAMVGFGLVGGLARRDRGMPAVAA